MSVREEKKLHTRMQIIAEATREFIKEGYEGAKLSNISKASGIAEGTLFNYFKNKPALFVATFTTRPYLNYDQFKIIPPDTFESFINQLVYILDFFMRIEDDNLEGVFKTFFHYTRQQQLKKDFSESDHLDQADSFIIDAVKGLLSMVQLSGITEDDLLDLIHMQINGIFDDYVYQGISFDDFLHRCRTQLTLICAPYLSANF